MQRLAIDSQQLQPPHLQLTSDQRHYLQRVLRLKSGAQFLALPGDGMAWRCELVDENARVIEAQVVTTELPVAVTLALALPKTGFEEVVRQVTELGVGTIVPLLSERTILNPSPNKWNRWQRIAAEASEQSERARVPLVREPIAFPQFLQEQKADRGVLCWGRGDSPHLMAVLSDYKSQDSSTPASIAPDSITIAIGPEGGWSKVEVNHAIAAGFETVSLGKRILRAVTAPIVAMAIVGGVWEKQG